MNVLVTGGAGFIGSHACVSLLEAGHNIVIADNFCNSSPEVLEHIKTITGRTFSHYNCDLLDYEELAEIFEKHEIDAVIHFAGLKSVPESTRIPLTYYHNNLTGTLHLLQIMEKKKVNRLVFSSSATVYGTSNQVPYEESMPTSATNPYGWTKVMIEQMLNDYTVANSDAAITCLRYFNPIGAHKSGLIGDNPNGIPNNLMPYVCQTAVGKLPFIRVFGTDFNTKDGTGVRDYLHVLDLAEGHVKALEHLEKKKGFTVYNLGTGQGTSVLELLDTFERVNNIPLKRELHDRRPGDIAESYANVDRAVKEIGWETRYSLEDMCRDSWNFIRTNTDKQAN